MTRWTPKRCPFAILVTLALLLGGCNKRSSSRPSSATPEPPPPAAPTPVPAAPEQAPVDRVAEVYPLPAAGQSHQRRIAGDARHDYPIALASGTFLHVAVDQIGVDVALSVVDPAGAVQMVVDGPTSGVGREVVTIVAEQPGDYQVRVELLPGQSAGPYRIRVEALRDATPALRRRAQAVAALTAGETQADRGSLDEAAHEYQRALRLWRDLDDQWGVATTHHRLGLVEHRRRRYVDAIAASTAAAVGFQGLHEQQPVEAMAWHNAGRAHYFAGDLSAAAAAYERALPLRAASDRLGTATTLTNLGIVYRLLGEPGKALATYRHALEVLTRLDTPWIQATILHNLGTLHLALGALARARDRLTDALAIRRSLGDARRSAATLDQLGRVAEAQGHLDTALQHFETAKGLAMNVDDRVGLAIIESRIGRLRQRQGQFEQAREAYETALAIMRDDKDTRAEAHILQFLASIEQDLERPAAALERATRALAVHQQNRELLGKAEALVTMASAQKTLGRLDQAWTTIRQALAILDSVRGKALATAHRESYGTTARIQNAYAVEMAIAMARHHDDPGAGWDTQALAASERARARLLLDLLQRTGTELRQDVDPLLLAQEKERQSALNRSADQYRALLDDTGAIAAQRAVAERRVRDDLEALAVVQEAIRAQAKRHDVDSTDRVNSVAPLQLDRLRNLLLDDGTALVAYWLGEPTSYVWVLRRDGLHSVALPSRTEIEALAQRATALLQRSGHRESRLASQQALCAVSRQVLAPAVSVLAGRRLLIAADGALRALPFAALPHPDSLDDCLNSVPLVDTHEVVHVPSASVAAMLAQRRVNRPPATRAVAVIADPVYSPNDPRLSLHRTGGAKEATPLPRLRFARREADAIRRRVPANDLFVAVDFDANRETISSGVLADYRVVHFATHTDLDLGRPEHSGIAVSMVDAHGQPSDGLVRVAEINTLDLNADLVTLSACRTGLGESVAGEGLVGLAYAFFHAGATQLLVSLWPVDDQATARLMEHFYEALLVEKQSTGAALRQAQRVLRHDPRWSAPYHWAGFVVLGDGN